MVTYDWTKIYEAAGGSAAEVVRIMRMVVGKQIPTNKRDPIYKYNDINFSGESFLAHADMLMYNSHKHSHKDICQYLALASLRPIADFLAAGLVSIDSSLVPIEPEALLNYVRQNELLGLRGGDLVFLYEEPSSQTVH